MSKTTATYWNPLSPENRKKWKPVEGLEGMAEEVTLAIDEDTGDYTRITRFLPGAARMCRLSGRPGNWDRSLKFGSIIGTSL